MLSLEEFCITAVKFFEEYKISVYYIRLKYHRLLTFISRFKSYKWKISQIKRGI